MRYKGIVIRPPSEAYSFLLQITYGCSHNKCAFCGTYKDKPFKIRPLNEVYEDIESASASFGPDVRKVFLCDGNALVLPFKHLKGIIEKLNEVFPNLRRISCYANARDIQNKSDDELNALFNLRLELLYIGLETGNANLMNLIDKGSNSEQMINAVLKAKKASIKTSVIAILGLGGKEYSQEHVMDTINVLNRMNPNFLSFLTLMIVPGTKMEQLVNEGTISLLTPFEITAELYKIVEGLNLKNTIFRTNHASNYAPLAGILSKDKERILTEIKGFLKGNKEFRPEFFRGL